MKKIEKISFGIIQKTIIILAIFIMSCVWPAEAFPVKHISQSGLDNYRISNPTNEENFVRQEFSPNFEQVESISVYISNDPDSIDTLKSVFRLYDYTGNCLKEYFFQAEELELPGYVNVPINMKLSPGILYFFTIGGVDGDLFVAYCNDDTKAVENGAFFYKEVHSGGTSVVVDYEYARPMGLKRIVIIDLFIAVCALVLILGINIYYVKATDEKWYKVELVAKKILYAILILGILVSVWGIFVAQLFTKDLLNNIVLFGGVVIVATILYYLIYSCKSITITKDNYNYYIGRIAHLCRSSLIAASIIFCCLYFNAMTNYEKGLWIRCLLTSFCLFIVSCSSRSEIFHWSNLVWTVVALAGGRYYVSLHSDHIEHINTAVRSAYVMWSMGLVVINLVMIIIKKQFKNIKNINILVFVSILVFWVLSVIFANGRTWPIVTLVVFGIWTLKYVTIEDKGMVLRDVFMGIILAFIGTTIFCAYRRPYQYFILTRYGGVFYTVTMTAVYLCLPISAALIKLRQYKKDDVKSRLGAGVLFGVAFAYLLFTASRTGLMAIIVAMLLMLLMPTCDTIKDFVKEKIKVVLVLSLSIIAGFVLTYSFTRMVPAMVSNPLYYFFESKDACIDSETSWEGEAYDYITVGRVIGMIQERVLGIEGALDREWLIKEGHLDKVKNASQKEKESATDTNNEVKNADEAIQETALNEYSNGRVLIFIDYLKALNLNGHPSIQLEKDDGTILGHAHNSYIQVAYDFGVPAGVVFVLYCLVVFVASVRTAWRKRKCQGYATLPFVIIVCFGVASLVEWVYHPCNPLGFIFLLVQTTLVVHDEK